MKKLLFLLALAFASCANQETSHPGKNEMKLNDLRDLGLKGKVKRMTEIRYLSENVIQKFGEWIPKDSTKNITDVIDFDADGNSSIVYRIVNIDKLPRDTTRIVMQYANGKLSGFKTFISDNQFSGAKVTWVGDSQKMIVLFDSSGKTISEEKHTYNSYKRTARSETIDYNDSGRVIYSSITTMELDQYGPVKNSLLSDKKTGKTDTVHNEVIMSDAIGNVTKLVTKKPDNSISVLTLYRYEYY